MDYSGGIGLISNYLSEIAKQQLFQLGSSGSTYSSNARGSNPTKQYNNYLFDARPRNTGICKLAPVPTLLMPCLSIDL